MCFAQCRCSPMLTDAHRCLPGHLDDHDVKHAKIHFLPNNRGELFSTIFCHFQPFSAIACPATSMITAQNTRKSIFDHFSTIVHHFPPFSAIVYLLTSMSITRNARKPMTAIFCHGLPVCLDAHASLARKLIVALLTKVKRERPCTTPCLFKAHLPTAHLHGLIRTSTRIPISLP